MTRTLLLITPGFVARGDFDARGRLVALGKAVPPPGAADAGSLTLAALGLVKSRARKVWVLSTAAVTAIVEVSANRLQGVSEQERITALAFEAEALGALYRAGGAEDLGGGLRAIFAIEHRFNVDTGDQANPAFWNGQAWVGLDGQWGRLSAGRQYTPMFNAMIAVDATADQWYGTLESSSRYATRFDNSLEYRTPSWNGCSNPSSAARGRRQPRLRAAAPARVRPSPRC
jgi:hypothetical protein